MPVSRLPNTPVELTHDLTSVGRTTRSLRRAKLLRLICRLDQYLVDGTGAGIGHRDRANECLLRDPALASPEVRPFISLPGGHNEGHHDTFKHLFRAFYDYIRAGDLTAPATFPTFADGHREIRLCEAILRSHRERAWVDMKE